MNNMSLSYSIDVIFFVLGAIVGSFLNVCLHRMPRGGSVVRPGSRCPACAAPIAFYDNIPLLSYLALRGRCRKCGRRISARYPLVELLTAVLFVVLYHAIGLSLDLAAMLLFSCLLVVISFIDLDFGIIPYRLSLGGIVLGVVLSFIRPSFGLFDALLGALAGCAVIYVIKKCYELLRKEEGMGGGDIWLLGMIGAFCGIKGVVFSLVAGSFAGCAVGIPLTLVKGGGMKYALPFGPFLSIGGLLYAIAGNGLIRLFYGLIDLLSGLTVR
ncbi:MAG: A24 family peptidase [Syntrophorhabdales bacterium]|jgi:leader peptidase (prepilin peptidase)/N-methyltransferase